MTGPLQGLKVLEVGSIGPGPFAAMMLADMGADVLRLIRPKSGDDGGSVVDAPNIVFRGRATVAVDLKRDEDRAFVLRLAGSADALIEGFRPGVMERLGLGPEDVLARNPRLVYGRVTGYGQDGPLAQVPGHDINYISIAGVLGAITRRGERPMFPLNLVGDFGGGGMLLAFGILCGVYEARSSGQGQVIDAAMVDGSALLATSVHGLRASGHWGGAPGTNFLDSGAHFYEVYETADGGHIAVGAIEPQFYIELLRVMELDPAEAPQWDSTRWPELKELFAQVFRRRTRDDWAKILETADACATPVLGLEEGPQHPHNVARGTFVEADGVLQPAPAPRFSRTPPAIADPPAGEEALSAWGLAGAEIAARVA
ncbi:MAG TPA: CaiB/BaiF CoA-transferase family protein [Solirubrobacteraceae bacterium]|jgi:alpha-methylacyl-CoA racemase|nr:CaiB/BaiF CoA-transferase family protein [Solirubrobacteraceae bacterium]